MFTETQMKVLRKQSKREKLPVATVVYNRAARGLDR